MFLCVQPNLYSVYVHDIQDIHKSQNYSLHIWCCCFIINYPMTDWKWAKNGINIFKKKKKKLFTDKSKELMQTSIRLLSRAHLFLIISTLHNPFRVRKCVILTLRTCTMTHKTSLMSSKWWFCTSEEKVGSSGLFPILTPCCLAFVTFLSFPILSLHPPAAPLPSLRCCLDIILALICHLFFFLLQESQHKKENSLFLKCPD